MKMATPPKGVTARLVSRRISRSLDSRAVISCGTELSAVFASTPLLSQALPVGGSRTSGFGFSRLHICYFKSAHRVVKRRAHQCSAAFFERSDSQSLDRVWLHGNSQHPILGVRVLRLLP